MAFDFYKEYASYSNEGLWHVLENAPSYQDSAIVAAKAILESRKMPLTNPKNLKQSPVTAMDNDLLIDELSGEAIIKNTATLWYKSPIGEKLNSSFKQLFYLTIIILLARTLINGFKPLLVLYYDNEYFEDAYFLIMYLSRTIAFYLLLLWAYWRLYKGISWAWYFLVIVEFILLSSAILGLQNFYSIIKIVSIDYVYFVMQGLSILFLLVFYMTNPVIKAYGVSSKKRLYTFLIALSLSALMLLMNFVNSQLG